MKNNFYDNDKLITFFNKVKEALRVEDSELELILSNYKNRCLFFGKYINKIIYIYGRRESEKQNLNIDELDYSELKEKKIDLSVLVEIITNTNHRFNSINEEILSKLYPEIDFLLNIKNTPRHIFNHQNDEESNKASFKIYEKIMNLPTPFSDQRFRALPLYTSKYNKKGLDRSVFLNNEKGIPYRHLNLKTNEITIKDTESGYNSFFMDSRIGVVFYFKDKASMLVSFNFDTENNIYIRQIQCMKKDRGHYKIKGDWKMAIIDYVKSLFPEHNILLISGKDSIENLIDNYKKDSIFFPTKITQERVKNIYDNLYSANNNSITKREVDYKLIN